MPPVALCFWDERLTLDEAFCQVLQAGVEIPVLKELGKRVLYLRSFKEYGVVFPDSNAAAELLKLFCQQWKLDSPEALKKWLEKNHQTQESLIKQLVFQEQTNRLKHAVIPETAVQEAFLKRKSRQDMVLFALIRLNEESIAQELYYRITDDGQDFGTLAAQYSTGPEAQHFGLVGPKPLNDLNPELKNRLIALKPGETPEPFTLDGQQYLLVRLLRMDSAQLVPQLQATLRDELFEQWTDRQLSLANIRIMEVPPSEVTA